VREPVELSMPLIEVLLTMSEGNAGAATVLGKMMNRKHGFVDVLRLDDMNMRGKQIWVAFKYYCDHDLDKLVKCIRAQDTAMIEKVNEMCHGEEQAHLPPYYGVTE
jgi:hypothetical protein